MNILEFMEIFPTEESCKTHFKEQRENIGITFQKFRSTKHYWLKSKWQRQCSECRFRTTLRSGTFMKASNLPVRK